MTPLTLLAIATTVGAFVFLAAGYVFGRSGQQPVPVEPAPAKLPDTSADLSGLRAENQRLVEESAELRESASRANALASENRELRATAASALGLRSEVTGMRSKVAEFDQLQAENEKLRTSAQYVDALRTEVEELRATAAKPAKELSVESRPQDAQKLKAQASQLSALRLQNDKLRAKVAGVDGLRAELKTTREQLSALQGTTENRRDAAGSRRGQHAATLAEFVEELVQGGSHAAAVADGQGLLIVGAGDPDVQLAVGAVGAQFMSQVSRVRGFLPMGTFASLEARDEEQRVLRIRRVEIENEALLLTTLDEESETEAEPDELVEALHRHVPKFIAERAPDESVSA